MVMCVNAQTLYRKRCKPSLALDKGLLFLFSAFSSKCELRLIFPSQILPNEDCAEAFALNSLAVFITLTIRRDSGTGGLEKPCPFQVLFKFNRMRKQKNQDSFKEPTSGKRIIVRT